MAGSQESFNKRDQEKKKAKKRLEKQQKQAERKANASARGFEDMIAYVDENGNITDTPPDPANRQYVDADTISIGVQRREQVEVPTTRTGRVEFFNNSKGFGFIRESETQEKYFVHINNVTFAIKEGDMVTFELERGFKGMNAIKVNLV